MTDMRSDDWRRDHSLTEAEIRRKMAEEGWEPVETVGFHLTITAAPNAYRPPTSVSPASVKLERVTQSA